MNFLKCGNLVDVHMKHNLVSVIAMFKIQNVLFPEIMKDISHFPLTERNKYKFRVNANFVSHSFFFLFLSFFFLNYYFKTKKQYMKNYMNHVLESTNFYSHSSYPMINLFQANVPFLYP